MICENCGKEGAQTKPVTKTYGKGDDLLVIENVPIIHCPHCHERYLTAQTLHHLEEVRHQRRGTVRRQIEVAQFASSQLKHFNSGEG